MTFEQWYNSEFTNELWGKDETDDIINEQVMMMDAYNAAIENNVPQPSTDFTIPMANPGKIYLMFDSKNGEWLTGFYDMILGEINTFEWIDSTQDMCEITHWLPLPNNP